MKQIFKLTLFPRDDNSRPGCIPTEAAKEAFTRWPHFQHVTDSGKVLAGVNFQAEVGSTDFDEILEFLARFGRFPQWTVTPPTKLEGKFLVGGTNEFSASDIDNAQYLRFSTERWTVNNLKREADGSYSVLKSDITKNQFAGSFPSLRTLCLDTMKRKIESSGFIGPLFQPIKVVGKLPPAEAVWRVMSTLQMPALKNRLINNDSELSEHQPGQQGDFRTDDLFQPWVPRYDASEIASMEQADVLLTKEDFGMDKPSLIVSQKFRRWCDQFKLHIKWVPIALE